MPRRPGGQSGRCQGSEQSYLRALRWQRSAAQLPGEGFQTWKLARRQQPQQE